MNTEIKELVAEGKIDEALDKLVVFLANQIDQFAPLYRAAQVAQSEFNQIKEKELQGVLSEEQIRLANNLAINRVLEILEQLDRGPSPTLSPNRRVWWWYAAGGAGLVLLIMLVIKGVIPGKNNGELNPGVGDTTQVQDFPSLQCPRFDKDTKYPISIFNFSTINPKDSSADQFLVEEIDAIFARNQFEGDATLVRNFKGLLDVSVAKATIERCKARMVIWGRVFDNGEIEINFYEPQLSFTQQAELDSLLQFRDQGNFRASIKQAALIIASRVLVINNSRGAVAVAEQAYKEIMGEKTTLGVKNAKKSNTESMATMTLANAHAKNKDYKTSIKFYNQLLNEKPHDTVALKNRAIAQIKSNDLQGAIKSIDTLNHFQKKDDPATLEKFGEELAKRGLTAKGVELIRESKRVATEQQIKNLPKEQ